MFKKGNHHSNNPTGAHLSSSHYYKRGWGYCQNSKCGRQLPDGELITIVDPMMGYKRICKNCFRKEEKKCQISQGKDLRKERYYRLNMKSGI
jgi:hypothetical protein